MTRRLSDVAAARRARAGWNLAERQAMERRTSGLSLRLSVPLTQKHDWYLEANGLLRLAECQ